jgi:hypothetical protein
MKRVVCLAQRPDGTEPLDGSLCCDVRGRDSVGALEVGHDESGLPGHSKAMLAAPAAGVESLRVLDRPGK